MIVWDSLGRGELVVEVLPRGGDRPVAATLAVVDPATDFWTGASGRLPEGALAGCATCM